MNSIENPESLSFEKLRLLELEGTNQYVFHGSDSAIEEFEPRQAHNHIKGEKIPDGDPAVFASSKVDYAIFMAIVNKSNCPEEYHSAVSANSSDGENFNIRFKATEKTISQLNNDSSGWVYVFDKDSFNLRKPGSLEYISRERVIPVDKVQVKKRDLPANIETLED